MSNPHYQPTSGRPKPGGHKPYWFSPRGEKSPDEGGPAHKDTITPWPKAGGPRAKSLNSTANFPIIKHRVVDDGVDGGAGGSERYTRK